MRSRYEIYEKERGRVLTTIPRLLHQLELQSISYIVRMNHFNVNELSTGTDLEILKNWAQNQQLVWRKEGGCSYTEQRAANNRRRIQKEFGVHQHAKF